VYFCKNEKKQSKKRLLIVSFKASSDFWLRFANNLFWVLSHSLCKKLDKDEDEDEDEDEKERITKKFLEDWR